MQEAQLSQADLGMPSAPAAEGIEATVPPSDVPGGDTPSARERQERLTADKIPFDQLAPLDYDKSLLFFGVVPLFVAGALLAACIVLYFYRRGKQWHDLEPDMRLDLPPETSTTPNSFATREIAQLAPTQPSERLSELDEAINRTKRNY